MNRARVLFVAALFLTGALIVVLGPVAICAYKQHNFARNIKVQIDPPSCVNTASASKPCQYLFSFEGERDIHSFQFDNGLQYEYDIKETTFHVTGLGVLSHKSTVISIAPSQVLFNGESLPAGKSLVRILVKQEGVPVSGYCEARW